MYMNNSSQFIEDNISEYNIIPKNTIYDRNDLVYDTIDEIKILKCALEQAQIRLRIFKPQQSIHQPPPDNTLLFKFFNAITFGWFSKFC